MQFLARRGFEVFVVAKNFIAQLNNRRSVLRVQRSFANPETFFAPPKFGEDGGVRACSVIAESGDDKPSYGCEQVRAERFQASIGHARKDSRVGFLTVLVYGHEEEVV